MAELSFGDDSSQAVARTRSGLYAIVDAGATWQQVAKQVPGRVDTFGFVSLSPPGRQAAALAFRWA